MSYKELYSDKPVVILSGPKKSYKTEDCLVFAHIYMQLEPNTKILFATHDFNTARQISDRFIDICGKNNIHYATKSFLELNNGSKLYISPVNQSIICGSVYKYIIIDNFDMIDAKRLNEFLIYSMPMIYCSNGKYILTNSNRDSVKCTYSLFHRNKVNLYSFDTFIEKFDKRKVKLVNRFKPVIIEKIMNFFKNSR